MHQPHSRLKSAVLSLAKFFEKASAYAQGKGYGTATVRQENILVHRLLARPPKLALDIGANVGEYTSEIRRYNLKTEIHLFEPSAINVSRLMEKFRCDDRVTVVPCALSNITGSAFLFSDRPGSGMASIVKRRVDHLGIDFDIKEFVATLRFEEYWTQTLQSREVDIAKIDAEGCELQILHGFGNAIFATKVLQFEFGGCNVDSRTFFRDFWYFFTEKGFVLYRITPLGAVRLEHYEESDEFFSTTNYIAVNTKR